MGKIKLRFQLGFFNKITAEQLVNLSFILFFTNSLFRTALGGILGNNLISSWIGILLPYIPLSLAILMKPRKFIVVDFIILMIYLLGFLGVTYLIHPEYEFYYMRPDYGIWDHVLKPYRGVYAYLFIRLIDDPKQIMKLMKTSGWMMMVYFIYRVLRGNWTAVTVTGFISNSTYSVSFGYEVLIFALVFLFIGLYEKRIKYLIAAGVDIGFILIAGSRGPVLFIGLFLVLYFLIYTNNSKRKGYIITLIILATLLVYLFYEPMLINIASLMERLHLKSRFIRMLMAGNITDDSNRFRIWNAAVDMIRQNPFGYGAMGSRHGIYQYVYAGYPHSVILELLIDYGVFVGGILIAVLFGYSFSILFSKRKREWCPIFLIFFCSACSMFISLTYWSRPEFWGSLALGICCLRDMRHKYKKRKINGKLSFS